jgi:hypothetical protein
MLHLNKGDRERFLVLKSILYTPIGNLIAICMNKLFQMYFFFGLLVSLFGCRYDLEDEDIAPGLDGSIHSLVLKPGPEGKDAIISSYYPEDNFGNGVSLNAMTADLNRIPYVERAYIDFDLSSIPSKATILNASLILYADTVSNHGGFTGYSTSASRNEWVLESLTTPWEETTITWF